MGFVTIDHNKINLNDDNFDEYDPETFALFGVITWCNRFKQCNACRKGWTNN